MNKFSVIVPVYNVEAYLERCMDSLLAQPCELCEILLVDDGSMDRSGLLCDQYAHSSMNVRVFHKKNGGLSSARNFGIDRAEGEYMLFVDSDDWVDKQMCEKLLSRLKQYPGADLVSFDGIEQNAENAGRIRRISPEDPVLRTGHDFLLEVCRTRNLNVQAWMYAYRSSFLKEHKLRFQEGILHEDVEFMPRVILHADTVLTIPEALYTYVVREGSISTGRDRTKNIKDLFQTLKEQCVLADSQKPELRKWMKNSILDSYLNMVMEAGMDGPEYRALVDKSFLKGKAATWWNHCRAALCRINIGWYCRMNRMYKRIRGRSGT